MKHLFAAIILQISTWLLAWGLQQTEEGLDWVGVMLVVFIFVLSILELVKFFQVLNKEKQSR